MPTAILADLDDTLLDDSYAMTRAVWALREAHALPTTETPEELAARWIALAHEQWRAFREGGVSLAGQRRARLRGLFRRALSDAEADALFAEYLEVYARHWRLAPGAAAFLARTGRTPKAIITNGVKEQAVRKVAALGLQAHFAVVVTPEDAGSSKPEARMFLHTLERLGAAPGEALMVGNSYEVDIAPALALGMAVFHVHTGVPGRTVDCALDAFDDG